jgi:hypothetical protein
MLIVQILDSSDAAEASEVWQRAAHWDAIQSGENAVSLSDARVLLDNNQQQSILPATPNHAGDPSAALCMLVFSCHGK